MARNPKLRIGIEADDKASPVMRDVADLGEEIDGKTISSTVEADDKASDDLADIRDKLERLDRDEARILLRAETKDARADLRAAQKQLIELDDEEARVEVEADVADAKRRVAALTAEVKELDQIDPDIDVDSKGMGELADAVGEVPGPLGDMVGGFSQLGPGGLIAGAGAAMFALAESQSNAALEAQVFADLTGTTVEHASAMLAVFQRADVELNDASDIALQLAGSLADNAEYAETLGINLEDGKNPAQRLVQVLDLMNDPMIDANDKAEIFAALLGEEGVRQGQRLATVVGNVGDAVDDVPEVNIFSDADVDAAREYEAAMAAMQLQIQGLAASTAKLAVPAMQSLVESASVAVGLVEMLGEGIELVPGLDDADVAAGILGGTLGNANDVWNMFRGNDTLTGAIDAELVATGEAAGETETGFEDLAESTARAEEAAKEHADQLSAEADALRDAASAASELVGDQYDVEEATWALDDASQALTEAMEDEDASLRDIREAQIGVAESAEALADAEVQVARDAAAMEGNVYSATDAIDDQNSSLVRQAGQMTGPQRAAILSHIQGLNNIPDDIQTEIVAAVNRGDLAEAERLIKKASANRSLEIRAKAATAAAERALNWAARPRWAKIDTYTPTSRGNVGPKNSYGATGMPYSKGGPTWVGEEGPELIDVPHGAGITNAQLSKGKHARLGNGSGSGSGSGATINVTNHFPAGVDPRAAHKAATEWARRNGIS